MTMIAFHARDTFAEVVTDGLAYTFGGRHIGARPESKLLPLPDIAAAVVVGGSTWFDERWRDRAATIAADVADFDEFTRHAEPALPAVWAQLAADAERAGAVGATANTVAFHVGYSPRAGRFKAYAYSSHFGFSRIDVKRFHLMPTPPGARPGPVERESYRAGLLADGYDPGEVSQLVTRRNRLPRLTAPATIGGWVDLAVRVRQTRSLPFDEEKVLVGGDVLHARLTTGRVEVQTIHRFDDTGPEFRRMVAGTLHPVSQATPCLCGSGRRYVDCHLPACRPCLCGSGRVFARCCSILNPNPPTCPVGTGASCCATREPREPAPQVRELVGAR